MTHSIFKVVLVFLAFLFSATTMANEQSALLRIEQYVTNGNFKEARDLAFGLDTTKLPADMQLRYCEAQIRIAFAFEDKAEMRYWVRAFSKVSSEATLDPATFPPEAIQLLNEVRDEGILTSKQPATQSQTAEYNKGSEKPPYKRDKSFNATLLPFGIGSFYHGHASKGALYLALQMTALAVGAASKDEAPDKGDELIVGSKGKGLAIQQTKFLNSSTKIGLFLGLWGYEVWDLLPELYAIDAGRAHAFQRYLSFTPLGVPQLSNGHTTKGVIFAVLQSLMAYEFLEADKDRNSFNFGYAFLGLWFISTIDGLSYYDSDRRTAASVPMRLSPLVAASTTGELSLGLSASYDF